MATLTETSVNSSLPSTITRRSFVKMGGALFVSIALPAKVLAQTDETNAPPYPTDISAWLEIRSDDTIVMRTGRAETGTGMSGYYPQAIAEELHVRPEVISLIMGDTDRTPDGGYSAGFLTGMVNVRKVPLTRTRRCSNWLPRSSAFPSRISASPTESSRAAEKPSVMANWFMVSIST